MTDGLDQPAAPERPRDTSARRARSVRGDEGVDAFQALQRVLYRSAKQDPGRRFHALYDKLTRCDVLWRAWVDVATNQGAPASTGWVSPRSKRGCRGGKGFPRRSRRRATGRDLPAPTAAAGQHPKPGQPGKTRPLSIPCVRDRVVMAAAKAILEPILEADCAPRGAVIPGEVKGLAGRLSQQPVRS